MGNRSSSVLTKDQLNEYDELTYLTKTEIVYIFRQFQKYNQNSTITRLNTSQLLDVFPEFKFNPFKDRLIYVFSSKKDNKLSFEDTLDLCSVFSDKCPLHIKAYYAFKIFDFDCDNQINKDDLRQLLTRLTDDMLTNDDKNQITDVFMTEMNLELVLGMSQIDFIHFIIKIPDFATVFSFHP